MTDLANELTNDSNENVADSWLASLPDELKSSKSLSKFNDVSALASSYLEAEKSLNSRVAIPKEDSSPEEWNKFYTRLGLPEDKRYTDKRLDEDEAYLTKYEEMFYNSGLSKRQGEKMLEGLYNFSSDLQKKQQEEIESSKNTNISFLKDYYKDEFDNKTKIMNAALSKFGSRELATLIEESNYSPALVDLLVKVGETLKSDSLVTGSSKAEIIGAESALKEIKKLEANNDFMVKYKDKTQTGHEEAVAQMRQLHEIAYNTK